MRRARTTALLATALLLAGCGGPGGSVADRSAAGGGLPSPAGATVVTSLPPPPDDRACGDPTASYRPAGGVPAPDAVPPGSTMAKIRDRGRLVVGVDQTTLDFGYRNPFTGRLEGFDVDIARSIAKALFGNPDAVQLRALTSAQRVQAVKDGEVDIVVRTMQMNCERWKDIDFSSAYFQTGQRVLVRKESGYTGLASLGGKKVCAAEGSTSIRNVVNAPSKPIGVQVPEWTDCLVMLQQHQVDAVSTDEVILAGMAKQDPFTAVVGPALDTQPYGVAIAKNRVDFVRFVNAVLERMRSDGEWTALYNRWVRDLTPNGDARPPVARYKD